jgi:hypothetical protein
MSSKIEVKVTDSGVKFGGAWFSHERITGYTAEQLNSGNCAITGREYMKWLANASAPVVERQPVAIYMHMDELSLFTSEDVSGGVAAVSKRPGDGMTALYTAPPELAELQATIARLTADLKIRDRELEIAAEQADDLQVEIERLKGGQGEPVAYRWRIIGSKEWALSTTYPLVSDQFETVPLYTSQPAPVSVVLPEPHGKQSNLKDTQYAMGWNACLDTVKELNQ